MMTPRESATVDRILAGDADAFRSLVDAHSRDLFRLACRMVGDPATAEDVVQDAFIRAYKALPRFAGNSGLGTWLHRITANLALDHLRQRQRQRQRFVPLDGLPGEDPADQAPSVAPGPDRQAISREIDQQVASALDSLSPMERTAFVLRHYEHHSSTEIGRALGTRPVTARQAVFRAVHKLRKILRPQQEAPDAAAS